MQTRPRRPGAKERLGSVEAYALARVMPEAGQQVTCSDVFADYRAWCHETGLVPLREAEFVAAFEELARAAKIPLRQRGGNLSFMDMALGPESPTAAMPSAERRDKINNRGKP